jgi:hypothetical protein
MLHSELLWHIIFKILYPHFSTDLLNGISGILMKILKWSSGRPQVFRYVTLTSCNYVIQFFSQICNINGIRNYVHLHPQPFSTHTLD